MKITKKRVFIGVGVVIGLFLVVGGVGALLYWPMLSTMLANNEVQGDIEDIPTTTAKEMPPLTKGEADWVCWRGPKGDGKSLVKTMPKDWSGGLDKSWSVNYLCQGRTSQVWSAPVVQGNRLVVCGRDEENDLVFCLSPEDGSLIWKASFPAKAQTSYGMGTRATPSIDDDRVYTFGRSGDLVCWKLLNGEKLWHANVNSEGGEEMKWGHSSSPLVTGSLVVVAGGGSARIQAYDKMTGKLVWKSGSGPAGYAAIAPMAIDGMDSLLHFHGKGLAGVALKDGKELWNTPWETSYDVNATTPVFAGDKVFITSGYGTGGTLLKVSATAVEVVWKSKVFASHHSDPFIIHGHLYGYSGDSMQNKGDFKCVELETGKEKWATGEMGWGTCVWVEGHLLCLDIKGNLYLMKPDPAEFVKVTELKGVFGKVRGAVWTLPVLANGRLYLRFVQQLVCLSLGKATS